MSFREGTPRRHLANLVICGDGEVDAGEVCDDANTVDGDGCSSSCQQETGWTCGLAANGILSTCTEDVDDGAWMGSLDCDDGGISGVCAGGVIINTDYFCYPGAINNPDYCTYSCGIPGGTHPYVIGAGKCDD
mmetsp:Transcript_7472/g.6764  ORF Transcript_7472/g.6764 Transcript_7472/m.6764 type:complete len:133 (-) Transcript_7472:2415-2813(-)